jgi:hypothetical protein
VDELEEMRNQGRWSSNKNGPNYSFPFKSVVRLYIYCSVIIGVIIAYLSLSSGLTPPDRTFLYRKCQPALFASSTEDISTKPTAGCPWSRTPKETKVLR